MAFGPARALLAEARERLKERRDPSLESLEAEARQQHGLCTYKDVDLPPGDRLDEALCILDGTDPLAVPGVKGLLATTFDPETLGIAGAVHKAKWKYDAQREHLEDALHYYDRGYRTSCIVKDNGYTAINAAFVLDLLASLEAEDLGTDDQSVAKRRARAQGNPQGDPRGLAEEGRRGVVVCRDPRRGQVRAGRLRHRCQSLEDHSRGSVGRRLGVRNPRRGNWLSSFSCSPATPRPGSLLDRCSPRDWA